MVLTLYATPLSANGRKVLAVSRELELQPDIRLVNVYRGEGRTAEYLAINPTGKIPTLVAHWQPALTQLLSPCVGHRLLPDVVPRVDVSPDWDAIDLRPLFRLLGATVDASPFLAGDKLTIADFAVAGMVTYFPIAGFPFKDHGRFRDWYYRIDASAGWLATRDSLWS